MALDKLDAYLCDLKEMQIRDGLHVFGVAPEGRLLTDLIVALARVPRGAGEGGGCEPAAGDCGGFMLAMAAAGTPLCLALPLKGGEAMGSPPVETSASRGRVGAAPCQFDLPLEGEMSGRTGGESGRDCSTPSTATWPLRGPGRARDPCRRLHRSLAHERRHGRAHRVAGRASWSRARSFARMAGRQTAGRARRDRDPAEARRSTPPARPRSTGLLTGLAGRFVAPGPSGAPTRGRPDVLPTGRNFYSVDSRAVPTADGVGTRARSRPSCWSRAMCRTTANGRHRFGLTAWGTSNMRTGGDDIAQALALIGAKPVWDRASRRVTGYEIIPHGEARTAARRRDPAHLGLLPRCLSGPDRAVRQGGAGGGRARGGRGRQSDRGAHAGRERRGWSRGASTRRRRRGGPASASSARSPAPMAPACRR